LTIIATLFIVAMIVVSSGRSTT